MDLTGLVFNIEDAFADMADLHRQAYNHAFEDLGLNWIWTRAMYAGVLDLPDGPGRIMDFMLRRHPDFATAFDVGGLYETIYRIKQQHFSRSIAAGRATPRPGVLRLLEESDRAGLKSGAIMQGTESDFDQLIRKLTGRPPEKAFTAWHVFEAGGLHMREGARNARVDLLARLGEQAGSLVAIEDSDRSADVSVELGMPVLATPGIYSSSDKFGTSRMVLSDLGQRDAPYRVIRGLDLKAPLVGVDTLRTIVGVPDQSSG
ncbi:HAD family hydrolase [Oceanomicrobium pacificus]|uniref:HAD family hydrolase n=1 Tax=Oceanomicrobium pacificus TaxID=2692916 RepID=A0A6B0TRM8_9RHOB|nr:hypothetical protein [Oceanomicrobium pacificus]MXU65369.1 hypothetical protein [Oceanomicrobium pacificus]